MSKIHELKLYLKELSLQIIKSKYNLKEFQRNNLGRDEGRFFCLKKLAKDYRHHHISYCFLKGLSYEQIENKCNEENKPDFELIQRIKDAYKENVCACA